MDMVPILECRSGHVANVWEKPPLFENKFQNLTNDVDEQKCLKQVKLPNSLHTQHEYFYHMVDQYTLRTWEKSKQRTAVDVS